MTQSSPNEKLSPVSNRTSYLKSLFLPRDAAQTAVMRLHVVRLSVCLSARL